MKTKQQNFNHKLKAICLLTSLLSLTGCVTGQSGNDSSNQTQKSAIQNVISSTNELKCVSAQFVTVHKECENGQICNGNDVFLNVTNKCGHTINSSDAYFLFASVDQENKPLLLNGNKASDFDYFPMDKINTLPMDKINTLYHPYLNLSAGESKEFLIQSATGSTKSLDTRFADGSLMVVDAKKHPNIYQCYGYGSNNTSSGGDNTISSFYSLDSNKKALANTCQEWLADYSHKITVKDSRKLDGEFLMNSSCQLSQVNDSTDSTGCSHIAYSTLKDTIIPLGNLDYWLKNPHPNFINEVKSVTGSVQYSFNQYGTDFYQDSALKLVSKYISNPIPADIYKCISIKIASGQDIFNKTKSQLVISNSCSYNVNISDYAIGFRGYKKVGSLTTNAPLVESTLELVDNTNTKLNLTYDPKYHAQLSCTGKCEIPPNDKLVTKANSIFVGQQAFTAYPAISGITHITSIGQQHNALSIVGEEKTSDILTNIKIGESAFITYMVSNNSQNNMLEKIEYKPLPHGFSYVTEARRLDCSNVLLSGGSSCIIKIKYSPVSSEKGNLQFNLPDALVKSGLPTILNIPYGTYHKPAEIEIQQINPETHNMNNRLTDIPVNSSGMVSYKIVNQGENDSQMIHLPELQQPFSYYRGWSDINYCDSRILHAKESCFVLIRYSPNQTEKGTLNYKWPQSLESVAKEKGFDKIPYATR